MQSATAGGSCRSGAIAGGVSAFASPFNTATGPLKAVVQAVIGGIASRLSGGKFENGAITAAFSYLFNEVGDCVMRGSCSSDAFGPPTASGEIRGCDVAGCGDFGASRGKRLHDGIDYTAAAGDTIHSPIDGKVDRIAYPGKLGLTGLVISGRSGVEVKIFYIDPDVSLIGKQVLIGDRVGVAQEIRDAYSAPTMTNHVHFEMRINGVVTNPIQHYTTVSSNGRRR